MSDQEGRTSNAPLETTQATLESILQDIKTQGEQLEARFNEKLETMEARWESQREQQRSLSRDPSVNQNDANGLPPRYSFANLSIHDEGTTSRITQPQVANNVPPLPPLATPRAGFGMDFEPFHSHDTFPTLGTNHAGFETRDPFLQGHTPTNTMLPRCNIQRDVPPREREWPPGPPRWHQPAYHEEERPQVREQHLGVKLQVQTFSGDSDADAYFEWVSKTEAIFDYYRYNDAQHIAIATIHFTEFANHWWQEDKEEMRRRRHPAITT